MDAHVRRTLEEALAKARNCYEEILTIHKRAEEPGADLPALKSQSSGLRDKLKRTYLLLLDLEIKHPLESEIVDAVTHVKRYLADFKIDPPSPPRMGMRM